MNKGKKISFILSPEATRAIFSIIQHHASNEKEYSKTDIINDAIIFRAKRYKALKEHGVKKRKEEK